MILARTVAAAAVLGAVAGLTVPEDVSAGRPRDATPSEYREYLRMIVGSTVDSDVRLYRGHKVFGSLREQFARDGKWSKHMRSAIASTVQGYNSFVSSNLIAGIRISESALRGQMYRRLLIMYRNGIAEREIRRNADAMTAEPLAPMNKELRAFGSCVSSGNSGLAWTIVSSEVGSEEENAAYAALQPVFSGCFESGSTMQMDKATIEGAVAEALLVEALQGHDQSSKRVLN